MLYLLTKKLQHDHSYFPVPPFFLSGDIKQKLVSRVIFVAFMMLQKR